MRLTFRILVAKKSDARELAGLHAALSAETQRLKPIRLVKNLKRALELELRAEIGARDSLVLKAVDERGDAIGILTAVIRKNSVRHAEKRNVYVHTLFVLRKHRRKGIGAALFLTLFYWMRRKRLHEAGLLVSVKNKAGARFYESMGFRTLWLNMKKFV